MTKAWDKMMGKRIDRLEAENAALTARVAELEAVVTKQAYAASTMLNIFDRGHSPNTAGRRTCDNLREATNEAMKVLEAK